MTKVSPDGWLQAKCRRECAIVPGAVSHGLSWCHDVSESGDAAPAIHRVGNLAKNGDRRINRGRFPAPTVPKV